MTCHLSALRLDADDPVRLARFWAGVLGQDLADDPEGGITLRPGDGTGFRIRVLPAQRQKSGPNHWHFHLTSTSLEDQQRTVAKSLEFGARPIDFGQRPEDGHVVLADPDSNAFCVIEPGNNYLAGCGFLAEVTCEGSREVGFFWSEALGWPLVWDRGLQTAIRSPRGGPKISWDAERMIALPESDRLHFDIAPAAGGDRQAEVDRLVSLGATLIGTGASWVTMADPDGREFRVLDGNHASL